MDKKFEEKIIKELKRLDREQIVKFAWGCGVLALPLIGSKGNFNFWEPEQQQENLYSLIFASDISFATANAAKAAKVAKVTMAAANANYATHAANANYAANAAHAIAKFAGYNAFATYAAPNAAYVAAMTAVSTTMATRLIDDTTLTKNLTEFIFIYLQNIKVHKKTDPINPQEFYGKVWTNFLIALKQIGCEYWGEAYRNIFENGFEVDESTLKRRLNVRKEIKEQGAAAVAKYLIELEAGAEQLNEARIIILGDKGSGKTSLTRKFLDSSASLPEQNESTPGVDTHCWRNEKEDLNIWIWDFAGHTITHTFHQFFLNERCVYVIVCNGRKEDNKKLPYWLNQIKQYGKDSSVFIVANKTDPHQDNEITINKWKSKYNVIGLYYFSIRDDVSKLNSFKQDIINYITQHPVWNKQEVPSSYYKIKTELLNRFDKSDKTGDDRITLEEFAELNGYEEVKNKDALLKNLNELGIALWYPEMDKYDKIILNPEWITEGIYTIINWGNDNRKYKIILSEFEEIFENNSAKFPDTEHEFFFDLMKYYKLAYEVQDDKAIIIPGIMELDQPKNLETFHFAESEHMRYELNTSLLPDTIARFIVLHHKQILVHNDKPVVWREGVELVNRSGSVAQVTQDERNIDVQVKGADNAAFLDEIRETLNKIFQSYQFEKPELKYRIHRYGRIDEETVNLDPLYLPAETMYRHAIHNVPYFDPKTGKHILLNNDVKRLKIEQANVFLNSPGNNFHYDYSTEFNFNNCNISLQGQLNDLAGLLEESGNKDAKDIGQEAKSIATELEKIENEKDSKKIKKTGVPSKIKRFFDTFTISNKRVHETLKNVTGAIGLLQDIAKEYNKIAQWLALPQVPTPFLGDKG